MRNSLKHIWPCCTWLRPLSPTERRVLFTDKHLILIPRIFVIIIMLRWYWHFRIIQILFDVIKKTNDNQLKIEKPAIIKFYSKVSQMLFASA